MFNKLGLRQLDAQQEQVLGKLELPIEQLPDDKLEQLREQLFRIRLERLRAQLLDDRPALPRVPQLDDRLEQDHEQ